MMPPAWKTLILPNNFPHSQVLRNYVFGHNQTHVALALDFGSVLNHHEDANVQAVHFTDLPPQNDVQFRVCITCFVCGNLDVLKKCSMHACMHAYKHTHTNTHTTDPH